MSKNQSPHPFRNPLGICDEQSVKPNRRYMYAIAQYLVPQLALATASIIQIVFDDSLEAEQAANEVDDSTQRRHVRMLYA